MLNIDVLKQLKADMLTKKTTTNGIVRATEGRSGLIHLDNSKKKLHLPTDQMKRVFPGDHVSISVVSIEKKSDQPKEYAQLVALLSSQVTQFIGYVTRYQDRLAILADDIRLNRTLLLPKTLSMGAQLGDYVHAELEKHPFDTGTAVAKVTRIIGSEQQSSIQSQYIMAKYGLPRAFSKQAQEQAKKLDITWIDSLHKKYNDLTHIPFITIDNANSTDLDDALYAQKSDQGWVLQVAIADPSAWFSLNSPIDDEAQKRGTSTYLMDQVCPMLPKRLSEDLCSLQAQQKRLAIVCTIQVNTTGQIDTFQFEQAVICSQAQLDYTCVNQFLETHDPALFSSNPVIQTTISTLDTVNRSLFEHRAQHHLVHHNRLEYQLLFDAQKTVTGIVKSQRNRAQKLVEECMIATNRCAAAFIQQTNSGLFISHPGFRSERLKYVSTLLKDSALNVESSNLNVQQYCNILHTLQKSSDTTELQESLKRHLQTTKLTTAAQPHFGMGLDCYTTMTSPIRKYTDLCVQRIIKTIIDPDTDCPPISNNLRTHLHNTIKNSRRAANELNNWVTECYFKSQNLTQPFIGCIMGISALGIQVKLEDSGLEGFIASTSFNERYHFDLCHHRLSIKSHTFILGQTISVCLVDAQVTHHFPRKIRFKWVPNLNNSKQET